MDITTKNLVEVTAAMEGAVGLLHLNVKNKGKEYLLAELEHRQHPTKCMHLTSAQKQAKKEKEPREILCSIEVDRLFTEERIVIEDQKKVSTFKPLSEKMEEWLEFQWKFIGDKENS
jgi:hypothetical protein